MTHYSKPMAVYLPDDAYRVYLKRRSRQSALIKLRAIVFLVVLLMAVMVVW